MTRILAVLACLFGAGAAAAEPVIYQCAIAESNAGGGYLSPQVIISHDAATGEAIVYDAIVHHVHGKPIPAKIVQADAKRLTVSWRVTLRNGTGQVTQMSYRAVYLKGLKSFMLSARPSGFEDIFEGRGTCKL
ncbi:hypothetical protein GEU84_003310 [Fertoebacter nigrum]|uniref:Uncharacterized protein n=1 Tax=Fertoeibacter niger TaxID=2656921 RepID=A0A8X8KPV9_9RHOB|nr:hypothetical protein [Fertoeibacter niger]NUB43402.1 hypothetical protein [Fertoeibacter niger]